MTLGNAGAAAALLAVAIWLARTLIKERLTASIRIDVEQKLHEFRTRLDAAEARESAVRQAAIDTNLQLNAAVVAERVGAIKSLWKGVIEWKAAAMVSTIVSAMTPDYVRRHGNALQTVESMKKMLDSIEYMTLMKRMNARQECRPFVTERAWALFTAYNGFFISRIMRAVAVGLNQHELAIRLWTTNSELSVVRATATPELARQYEANEVGATLPYLNYIEQELLTELQKSLAGEHSGPEAARQAATIVAVATQAMIESQKPLSLQIPGASTVG